MNQMLIGSRDRESNETKEYHMNREYKNLGKIFAIKEADENQIIIKCNAEDTLTIAQYPFMEKDYDYITVTRGDEHILTIIYKDGHTYSFHWGTKGYTLIDHNSEELRKAVVQFIEENDYILGLSCFDDPYRSVIYPRSENPRLWQLSLDYIGHPNANVFREAKDLNEAIDAFKPFIEADSWNKDVAMTGITIYKPVNPVYHFK